MNSVYFDSEFNTPWTFIIDNKMYYFIIDGLENCNEYTPDNLILTYK